MRIAIVLSAYVTVLVAAVFAPGDLLAPAALLVGLVAPEMNAALAAGSIAPLAAALLLNAVPFAAVAGPRLRAVRGAVPLVLAALAGAATVALVIAAAAGVDRAWAARGIKGVVGLVLLLGIAPGAAAAALTRIVPMPTRR